MTAPAIQVEHSLGRGAGCGSCTGGWITPGDLVVGLVMLGVLLAFAINQVRCSSIRRWPSSEPRLPAGSECGPPPGHRHAGPRPVDGARPRHTELAQDRVDRRFRRDRRRSAARLDRGVDRRRRRHRHPDHRGCASLAGPGHRRPRRPCRECRQDDGRDDGRGHRVARLDVPDPGGPGSQVLTIRERSYVEIARANGVGTLGVIFKEVMPNLMPWVGAAFVGTVSGAIVAAVGLEAIGLGANDAHTLRGQHLLGPVLLRDVTRHVVVVDPADRDDRLHLHDALHDLVGDGPFRQPPPPARLTR